MISKDDLIRAILSERAFLSTHSKEETDLIAQSQTVLSCLRKQIPQKPIKRVVDDYPFCPMCGNKAIDESGVFLKYCNNCGQRLKTIESEIVGGYYNPQLFEFMFPGEDPEPAHGMLCLVCTTDENYFLTNYYRDGEWTPQGIYDGKGFYVKGWNDDYDEYRHKLGAHDVYFYFEITE